MRRYEESRSAGAFSARMIKPMGACYQVCRLGCRRATSTSLQTRRAPGQVAHPEFHPSAPRLCSRKSKQDEGSSDSPATRPDSSGCRTFFIFSPFLTAKLHFDMQLLHTMVAKKPASMSSPSPLALFMHGCEREGEKRVKPPPRVATAALLPQTSLGTSSGCSFTAAKTHLNAGGNALSPAGS